MKRVGPALLLGICLAPSALVGCKRSPAPQVNEPAWIVLVPATSSEQPLEPLRVEPRARSVTRVGGRIIVEVDPNVAVRITPHEGCSLDVDGKSLPPGERVERTLDESACLGGLDCTVGGSVGRCGIAFVAKNLAPMPSEAPMLRCDARSEREEPGPEGA